MCGVEISDLSCLASGHNYNLTSEDMADLRCQGISFDDNNYPPPPEKIHVPGTIPIKQLEEDNSWRSEGIIFPRLSNNLHNTNDAFNNYTP